MTDRTIEGYSRLRGAAHLRNDEAEGEVRPRFLRAYPVWCEYALMAVGILVVFPVAYFPWTNLNVSAPLAIAILLEVYLIRPRYVKSLSWLLLPAFLFIIATVVSSVHGFLYRPDQSMIGGIQLMLRFIYWPAIMVAAASVVAFTPRPRRFLYVLGWSVVVLSALRVGSTILAGGGRPDAFGLSPNNFGFLFSSFAMIGLSFPLILKNKKLGVFCAILCTLAILADASRGNWVSIGAAVLVLTWTLRRQFRHLFVLAAVLTCLAGIVYFSFGHLPSENDSLIVQKINSFRNLNEDPSYTTRKAMTRKAWALFLEHPLLGIGPGGFTEVQAQFTLPQRLKGKSLAKMNTLSAHNAYAQLLAEQGLFGAIPFALILLFIFYRGWKASNGASTKNNIIPQVCLACAVATCIHLWVIAAITGTQAWLVLGLLAGTSSRRGVVMSTARGRRRVVRLST